MAELTPSDAAVSAWIEDNPREFAAWIDAQRSIGGPAPAPPDVADEVLGGILRDILEALCRRDGVPLHSYIEPGKPAANYALAERLGIGHVFGLPGGAAPAPAGEDELAEVRAAWAEAEKAIDRYREEVTRLTADRDRLHGLLNEAHIAEPQPQAAPELVQLRWAPYQEFGIPDRATEKIEPPAFAFTVGAVGYRRNDIIVYWVPAAADAGKPPALCADGEGK